MTLEWVNKTNPSSNLIAFKVGLCCDDKLIETKGIGITYLELRVFSRQPIIDSLKLINVKDPDSQKLVLNAIAESIPCTQPALS